MDILGNLLMGFGVAATASNLAYCFIGVTLGTLIGVLPGIGPSATLAMLLPMTFGLPATTSLIMLAGIFYGAQYGGSTTAILVNLPGEASSAVTTIDGYQMARQGKGGAALGVAAIGSFFGGTIATIFVAVFAPLLASVALSFGPAEYFSLMLFGLIGAVVLASGSILKAIGMILLGLLTGLVGTDVQTNALRFTFGFEDLFDGMDVVVVAMGIFAFSEIAMNLDVSEQRERYLEKVKGLYPSWQELKRVLAPCARGTIIGTILGVLPGGGPLLASFSAYTVEKKIAKEPGRFGHGAIEGVAAPETANNAAAQTSFIPLLTLGIPTSGAMALMLGAMILQGISPGPLVMSKVPNLFWGMIASMWIGNGLLLILNLPLIGVWVKLLTVPYRLLFPAILAFCCLGLISFDNNTFDIYLGAAFGLLGYVTLKLGCEPTPFLLGFILGPMMEENLRRALVMSRGDATVFLTRPISAAFILLAAGLLVSVILPSVRARRKEAFSE
ncbi:MAG: tripartite tricarboxylate transporter permease [Candidatus Accumulibacter sp.]|jgi:TctA family transporter|nr:tripartite tricarboxylate transporter permease [Accumulibacter sp.]